MSRYGTIFEWLGPYESLNDLRVHLNEYGDGKHVLYMAVGEDDRCNYIGAATSPDLPGDFPEVVAGTRIYFGVMLAGGDVLARTAAKQALICVLLDPNPDQPPHSPPDKVTSVFSCFYDPRDADGVFLETVDDAQFADPPGVPRVPTLVGFNVDSGQWFVVADQWERDPPAPPQG